MLDRLFRAAADVVSQQAEVVQEDCRRPPKRNKGVHVLGRDKKSIRASVGHFKLRSHGCYLGLPRSLLCALSPSTPNFSDWTMALSCQILSESA
jgi:hypothetical protein